MQLPDYFDKIYVATIADVAFAILSAFVVHWAFSLCITFDPFLTLAGTSQHILRRRYRCNEKVMSGQQRLTLGDNGSTCSLRG